MTPETAGFIDKDFLLCSKKAVQLYFDYAETLPIIDYHCHIPAADIYNDKRYADLTDIWLSADHYKWRIMRACGISEQYITGDSPPYDKFLKFAQVLPLAPANPVYHWAHLELQRLFHISTPLNEDTAADIWEQTRQMLISDASLSTRGILGRLNTEVIITTDDPADSLEYHRKLASDKLSLTVLPCFRPDAVLGIENKSFSQYVTALAEAAGCSISCYDDLKSALIQRIEFFDAHGCPACDHGLRQLAYNPAADNEIDNIFKSALGGQEISSDDSDKYRYALMVFLAEEYARRGWVMELHFGVNRDVNSRMYEDLGANTGFDCIAASADTAALGKFMDTLNSRGSLPKMLIFSINPNDNAAINTLSCCFCSQGIVGSVQQGSAWWFNDSHGGIKSQLLSFAENGVLGTFIGMLTDSRSPASYTRHEYFRRILCSFLAQLTDSGSYPDDDKYLKRLVENICHNNVKNFFRL